MGLLQVFRLGLRPNIAGTEPAIAFLLLRSCQHSTPDGDGAETGRPRMRGRACAPMAYRWVLEGGPGQSASDGCLSVLITVHSSDLKSSSGTANIHSFGKIISTDETILHRLRFRITRSVPSGFSNTISHPYYCGPAHYTTRQRNSKIGCIHIYSS